MKEGRVRVCRRVDVGTDVVVRGRRGEGIEPLPAVCVFCNVICSIKNSLRLHITFLEAGFSVPKEGNRLKLEI